MLPQRLWRDQSVFVRKVVSGAFAIVNATNSKGDHLFLDKIVEPIVREVFYAASTPVPSDADLKQFVSSIFDTYSASFEVGGCSLESFGQFLPQTRKILLNTEWVIAAENVLEAEDVSLPLTDLNRFEANVHVVFGVHKAVHEILHSLTDSSMSFLAAKKFLDVLDMSAFVTPPSRLAQGKRRRESVETWDIHIYMDMGMKI